MDTTEAVMDLAKRRGFLYPAFEVYGGAAGFYDYGPLGAVMKKRFEDLWRHFMLNAAIPMAEVSCPRVTIEEVLKASGHVDEFTDLVVKCGACGTPMRADHLVEEAGYEGTADALGAAEIDAQIDALAAKCPQCGKSDWSSAAPMNLMFQTEIGPGSGRVGYLRPETAQGIFTDFPHLLRYFRGKLPFGGIQLGRSSRNEISPRQGMIRLREFSMMEAEAFFEDTGAPLQGFDEIAAAEATFVPSDTEQPVVQTFEHAVASGMVANQALAYFIALTQDFLIRAGIDRDRLRFRQHLADEMAHYATDCWDAEFHSDRYGWVECVGIADRGCYDLTQHAEASGKLNDFQTTVDFPEPFTLEAARFEPVMSMLGRTFKADAKPIAAALEGRFEDELRRLVDLDGFEPEWLEDELVVKGPKQGADPEGPTTVRLPDGTDVEVPADAYRIIAGTWTVSGRKLIPRVIEPSFGVDRILYALWEHAYEKTTKNEEDYVRMRLSPHVAPIQAAVLPLTNDDTIVAAAQKIESGLRRSGVITAFDTSGNIGRRYARQDEVGTPLCITVDTQTPVDGTVTIRDRDTTDQKRVQIVEIMPALAERFAL